MTAPSEPNTDPILEEEEVEVVLANESLSVRLLSRGASLVGVNPVGQPSRNLVLALPTSAHYRDNPFYFGVTAGPVANRIAGAAFEIEGRRYRLEANEGANQVHGGPRGFGRRLWAAGVDSSATTATFTLHRPDGDGGYPGNLDVEVVYRLEGSRLVYEWTAESDRPTPVSLTNHAYWNLGPTDNIIDHDLTVRASHLVEVDGQSLPTGERRQVADTAYDLQQSRSLAEVLTELDTIGLAGIDRCYVPKEAGNSAVVLTDTHSGTSLTISSTLPGVQVYTGHYLDGSDAGGGHKGLAGICLETQHLPDAVNQPQFPSSLIKPGEPVTHRTVYDLEFAS